MLGLEPYLKRKPAALSGGQRQRVAMGRAIVREPQAFLMDEPLSNLDAKLRVSMRASLNQLHERLGVTTVYVTHDQVEAMTLGNRVAVLRDGRLQQVDTPQALFEAAGQLVRGRVHRLPRDELRHRGPGPRRRPGRHLRRLQAPGPGRGAGRQARAWRATSASRSSWASARRTSRTPPSATPAAGTMAVTAGVTEELGSEINVIFTIDAPHVEHASIAEASEASEDEDEATAALIGGKSLWTARVSKESRVRHGAPLELSVDTRYLQFFDPASGLSIGHPQATAALATSRSVPETEALAGLPSPEREDYHPVRFDLAAANAAAVSA